MRIDKNRKPCTRELSQLIGISKMPGSSTKVGKLYHDIPFEDYSVHRKGTAERIKMILAAYSVAGKKGLDLGCSVGGISFYLQETGAEMTGIDYDSAVINFAKAVAVKYKCPVSFICSEINQQFIDTLKKDSFDFAIWLDNWMWIEKAYGWNTACLFLGQVSLQIPTLFFSTSQNDGKAKNKIKTAKDVETLLRNNTHYTKIKNLGAVNDNWHKRSIFICER